MRLFAAALAWAVVALTSTGIDEARAHALQPGYLELQPLGGDTWRVLWRKPDVKGTPMTIDARLPKTCTPAGPPPVQFDGAAWLASWVATCPGGLAGGDIVIDGLELTNTDVLVRYELTPGQGRTRRLTAQETGFSVPAKASLWGVFASYLELGTTHILEGFDHLLFVFALLLLITDRRRLIGAITAFTVAHSLTLAASTLGWLALPGPPVEAIIALTIMFLAAELVQRRAGAPRLSERYPWLVSFAFGLLHGFGFAGALAEIGLPADDVPLALLDFNLGVEAGQLAFVAAVLAAAAVLSRLLPRALAAVAQPAGRGYLSLAYAIGGLSAFWFIERIASF
jgi:hydrogenase/urease accessory protein HupE